MPLDRGHVLVVAGQAIDGLGLVVQADGAEGHRHALPGPQGGAIHQLGMHVGFGAVARIAAVADSLARGHPLADADGQRSALPPRLIVAMPVGGLVRVSRCR